MIQISDSRIEIMPPKAEGGPRPTPARRSSRRTSSQAEDTVDTREPSETADEMIVSPNPPKPGTGTKKKKTAATAAKRDTPTSTRRRRERDQGEKQDGDDGDDNGNDNGNDDGDVNDRADGDDESADPSAFTLPTLPKPTKPMSRDEYAEYLLAEMRLEEVVLQKAQEIKANLANHQA